MAASLRSYACVFAKNLYANIGVNVMENTAKKFINPFFHVRKTYSQLRKKRNVKDPRKNTQYPFVPGDPLHEDSIESYEIENEPLKKISMKNKKKDEIKSKELQKISRVYETPSGLQYEVLKEGDKRFGQLIMDVKSTQPGNVKQAIVLEGHRLILDALVLGAKMLSLYFCEIAMLSKLPAEYLKDIALYKVTVKDMKVWADTSTPSGIMAIFAKPRPGELIAAPEETFPITLIFDSLKDPGNAGTLIRTAAAIGCQRLITTKGSVNIWDPKVIRSAMGGHFCLPIYTGLNWAEVSNYVDRDTQVLLANSQPAHILSQTFNNSLTSEHLDNQVSDIELSDSDNDTEDDKEAEEIERAALWTELEQEKKSSDFHQVPLTVFDYSDIQVVPSPAGREGGPSIALVLGGETEGLSALSKKFAYEHYGQYVTIPMSKNVNSLNTGIAGSLILYELRRKLIAEKNLKKITDKDLKKC